jgi:hypothetical protein
VGPFLFALGSLAHLWRAGIDAMWDEISVTLSYGVYGVGLGAIGLYLWNLLFVAPARMDQEAARKAGGERDALLRQANDLRDQLIADAEARTALPAGLFSSAPRVGHRRGGGRG